MENCLMSIEVYLSKIRSRGCGSLLGTHSWKIKTSMQEQDHINLACKLPQNTKGGDVSLNLKINRCPYSLAPLHWNSIKVEMFLNVPVLF